MSVYTVVLEKEIKCVLVPSTDRFLFLIMVFWSKGRILVLMETLIHVS